MLSDASLRALIVHGDERDRKHAKSQLRFRIQRRLMRNLANRKGWCSGGRRVVIDDNGVYSSGYILHDDGDRSVCSHEHVEWDPWTEYQESCRQLLADLRRT